MWIYTTNIGKIEDTTESERIEDNDTFDYVKLDNCIIYFLTYNLIYVSDLEKIEDNDTFKCLVCTIAVSFSRIELQICFLVKISDCYMTKSTRSGKN